MCGICQDPFDACAPNCTFPGDDCPPCKTLLHALLPLRLKRQAKLFRASAGWGRCKHVFHMQCIMKWLESSQDDVPSCPMCRQPWEFAADDQAEGATASAHVSPGRASDGVSRADSMSSIETLEASAQFSNAARQVIVDSDDESIGGRDRLQHSSSISLQEMDSGSDMGATEVDSSVAHSASSSSVDLDLDVL